MWSQFQLILPKMSKFDAFFTACVYHWIYVLWNVEAIFAQNQEKQSKNSGSIMEKMVHTNSVSSQVKILIFWLFFHFFAIFFGIYLAISMLHAILQFYTEISLVTQFLSNTMDSSKLDLWHLILFIKMSKLAGNCS